MTTIDLGRDVDMLEQVSRGSGVHIICATGTWLDIPRVFWSATPDMIAPLYVREIKEGIEGTGIRAGIIKVANDVRWCDAARGDNIACGSQGAAGDPGCQSQHTPGRPNAWASSRSASSRMRA